MSEPKYISKEREEAEALDDEELVVMFGNVSQPDDYDGVFTTRGLNICEAYEKVVINRLANLRAELARRDKELSELNDKAVFIRFENEDELPSEIQDDVYSAMFECSHVDGVRLFPYIEENGQKYFLVMLKEVV